VLPPNEGRSISTSRVGLSTFSHAPILPPDPPRGLCNIGVYFVFGWYLNSSFFGLAPFTLVSPLHTLPFNLPHTVQYPWGCCRRGRHGDQVDAGRQLWTRRHTGVFIRVALCWSVPQVLREDRGGWVEGKRVLLPKTYPSVHIAQVSGAERAAGLLRALRATAAVTMRL